MKALVLAALLLWPAPASALVRLRMIYREHFDNGGQLFSRETPAGDYLFRSGRLTVTLGFDGDGPLSYLRYISETRTMDPRPEIGHAGARFVRRGDGTVLRQSWSKGQPVQEVPVEFVEGSWEDYLRGKTVRFRITPEGYRRLDGEAVSRHPDMKWFRRIARLTGGDVSEPEPHPAERKPEPLHSLSLTEYRIPEFVKTREVIWWVTGPGKKDS